MYFGGQCIESEERIRMMDAAPNTVNSIRIVAQEDYEHTLVGGGGSTHS